MTLAVGFQNIWQFPSLRYHRQLGLVFQERVADVTVFVNGTNLILPYILTQLAFLGVATSQGYICVPENIGKVTHDLVEGQLLFKKEDIGSNITEVLYDRIRSLNPQVQIKILSENDIESHDYDFVIALPREDEAILLPKSSRIIWGQIGKISSYVGYDRIKTPKYEINVLTPSLSAAASAIIAQEILRVKRLIRPYEILKTQITVNFYIRYPNIGLIAAESRKKGTTEEIGLFKFKALIGGEEFKTSIEPIVENGKINPHEAIFRVVLPEYSFLSRFLYDSIEVLSEEGKELITPMKPLLISPIKGPRIENGILIEPNVKVPDVISGVKVTLFGVGGIGSWVAALIAITRVKDADLIIVDMDDVVEEHNLNRQILYDNDSLGLPKAEAAAKRIKELNPRINVKSYLTQVKLNTIKQLIEVPSEGDATNHSIETEDKTVEVFLRPSEEPALIRDIKNSDIILTTFDNLRGRYLTSFIAKIINADFINAGAQDFIGNIDFIKKDDGCLICRYGEGIKYDETRHSCTEWGEIPMLSIVTTVSFIAALQTALLIARVANIGELEHYYYYRGRENKLYVCPNDLNCPIHGKKAGCPKHLNSPTLIYF